MCVYSSPDLCLDSASKRGSFIGRHDWLFCVLWPSVNTDFTLVLRLLMLQFIVELVIITQNCFSSSLLSMQCIEYVSRVTVSLFSQFTEET